MEDPVDWESRAALEQYAARAVSGFNVSKRSLSCLNKGQVEEGDVAVESLKQKPLHH